MGHNVRADVRSVLKWAAMAAGVAATLALDLQTQAHAADLGGGCCADLEERIAELEAATGRKGNRSVSLTISGFLNPVVLTFSSGGLIVDIGNAGVVAAATPGIAVVVSGSRLVVLNAASLSHEDRARRSVLNGVDQTVGGVLDGTIACAASDDDAAHSAPQQCTKRGVWAAAIGGYSDIDATRTAFSAEQTLVGGLAGVHFDAAPGITLGLFGGYAQTDLQTEFDAENIETSFGIAGAFARLRNGQGFADVSVAGLWSDSARRREILRNFGGPRHLETATANANGWLISPALTVGLRLPVASDTALVPAFKMRGNLGQLDGFTETGSSSNVTISARDIADIEARIDLGLNKSFDAGGGLEGVVRARVGLSLFSALGDDTINGQLLGQAISFSSGAPHSEFGGYVGLGLDVPLSASVSLFADTELHLTDRAQEISGAGGVKVKF